MAFWDTSAIVPLCCSQPATARCRRLLREDPRLVAWWGAPLAEDLPDEYAVRAADALQLAAALVWCREKPRRRAVVCFDDQLAKAAAAVGFTVRP